MTTNTDKPLFINFYDEEELINDRDTFVGYILTEHFLNMLSKIYEILNISINSNKINNDLINSKNTFDGIEIHSDNKYMIFINRHEDVFCCNKQQNRHLYEHLSSLDYVYLQISSRSWSASLCKQKIFEIQELLIEHQKELIIEICYL